MIVVCCGMIRSGSTLQFNMARELIEAAKCGVAHGFISEDELSGTGRQLLEWAADRRFHVVKSHSIEPVATLSSGQVYLLYTFRDLRDVALSAKRKWGLSGDQLMASLTKAVGAQTHLAESRHRVLEQRYEHITNDPAAAVEEIARFLAIPVTPERAQRIARTLAEAPNNVEASATQRLRYTLAKTLRRNRDSSVARLLRRTPLRSWIRRFIISGSVYDPKTLLHPDHVSSDDNAALTVAERERINATFRTWLRKYGYSNGLP